MRLIEKVINYPKTLSDYSEVHNMQDFNFKTFFKINFH